LSLVLAHHEAHDLAYGFGRGGIAQGSGVVAQHCDGPVALENHHAGPGSGCVRLIRESTLRTAVDQLDTQVRVAQKVREHSAEACEPAHPRVRQELVCEGRCPRLTDVGAGRQHRSDTQQHELVGEQTDMGVVGRGLAG
jgi:hypothetical protein